MIQELVCDSFTICYVCLKMIGNILHPCCYTLSYITISFPSSPLLSMPTMQSSLQLSTKSNGCCCCSYVSGSSAWVGEWDLWQQEDKGSSRHVRKLPQKTFRVISGQLCHQNLFREHETKFCLGHSHFLLTLMKYCCVQYLKCIKCISAV